MLITNTQEGEKSAIQGQKENPISRAIANKQVEITIQFGINLVPTQIMPITNMNILAMWMANTLMNLCIIARPSK